MCIVTNFVNFFKVTEPLQLDKKKFFKSKIEGLIKNASKKLNIEIKTMPIRLSEAFNLGISKIDFGIQKEISGDVFKCVIDEKNRYVNAWSEFYNEFEKKHPLKRRDLYDINQEMLGMSGLMGRDNSFTTNIRIHLNNISDKLIILKKSIW